MSFSALPLLAPPDKCTCLFDTSIHMALSPLWLLVYTEHNNAIMKGRRGGTSPPPWHLSEAAAQPWAAATVYYEAMHVCLRVSVHVNMPARVFACT